MENDGGNNFEDDMSGVDSVDPSDPKFKSDQFDLAVSETLLINDFKTFLALPEVAKADILGHAQIIAWNLILMQAFDKVALAAVRNEMSALEIDDASIIIELNRLVIDETFTLANLNSVALADAANLLAQEIVSVHPGRASHEKTELSLVAKTQALATKITSAND